MGILISLGYLVFFVVLLPWGLVRVGRRGVYWRITAAVLALLMDIMISLALYVNVSYLPWRWDDLPIFSYILTMLAMFSVVGGPIGIALFFVGFPMLYFVIAIILLYSWEPTSGTHPSH